MDKIEPIGNLEKISIITISYNSESSIPRTLQSVLQQEYRPLEYILVDGASTDSTVSIIRSYLPRLEAAGIEVLFRSEQDQGISDAFNKGIALASGTYIGIINSDDCLADGALARVGRAAGAADVICGDCLWVDEKHQISYVRKSRLALDKLKYEMVLMHPACFIRKQAYETWGGYDTSLRLAMDKDLLARFYRNGATFAYLPEVLALMSAGGVSDQAVKSVYREGILIAKRNGVPGWKAQLRALYQYQLWKGAALLKRHAGLWGLLKGNHPPGHKSGG